MSQEDKSFLNLAGEFVVASELNRRQILASVTYGASKSADVFALSRDMTRLLRIEVKTTNKNKWPVGTKITELASISSPVLWVLVQLPAPLDQVPKDDSIRGAHTPRFFVLTAEEIHKVWKAEADIYRNAYQARHGHESVGLGVPNVSLKGVIQFENNWFKIQNALKCS